MIPLPIVKPWYIREIEEAECYEQIREIIEGMSYEELRGFGSQDPIVMTMRDEELEKRWKYDDEDE